MLPYNKKFNDYLLKENIIKENFYFIEFDLHSLINDITYIDLYTLKFNIELDKLIAINPVIQSFKIIFMVFNNIKNPEEKIFNIMIENSYESELSEFIRTKIRNLENVNLEEFSGNDFMMTLNLNNQNEIKDAIGNLIAFTINPMYFLKGDIDLKSFSVYNYNLAQIMCY